MKREERGEERGGERGERRGENLERFSKDELLRMVQTKRRRKRRPFSSQTEILGTSFHLPLIPLFISGNKTGMKRNTPRKVL